MNKCKQILSTVITAFLICFLAFAGANTALASQTSSEVKSFNAPSDMLYQDELKGTIIVEKRVCRYVDGLKRCWYE